MGHYLITGRSGSGKSEIYRELNKRSIPTVDGDHILQITGDR